MSARFISGLEELESLIGEELGPSGWEILTQERIDAFAEITGDEQWIHVDRERAAKGPFGATVAHGYLTVALLPGLVRQIYRIDNVRSIVNMGSDRVRFPAPVPSGARIRAKVTPASLSTSPNGARLESHVIVECDRTDKPVCVAETLSLIVV